MDPRPTVHAASCVRCARGEKGDRSRERTGTEDEGASPGEGKERGEGDTLRWDLEVLC